MNNLTNQAAGFDFEAVFEVDDYMYFYSETLTGEITDHQVASILELLSISTPLKILDLACGFGRHANRFATLGHQVTGIDLMDEFLTIARRDAFDYGVKVDYQQGDMRQINYQAEYDLVLLLFTAFGYFNDLENLQVLQNIHHALSPGGRLVFDSHNRDVLLNNLRPFIVSEKDGNLMIDRLTFDTLTGRLSNQRIVIRDGIRKDKPFTVRLYNPTEISELLKRAGFDIEKIAGSWDGEVITSDSKRMIVVARKPGESILPG